MEHGRKKFISWRRPPLKKRKSGYNVESQKDIIDYFVKEEKGILIADYQELYDGFELDKCVELIKAMAHCKRENAILIIAKTDRFYSVTEALQVYDEMGDGNIYFCDLPYTDKTSLKLFFELANRDGQIVSIVTKSAFRAKSAKGETWDRKGRETIHKAVAQSARMRVERAKNDTNNVFFKDYMEIFESNNGIVLGVGVDNKYFEMLSNDLNKMGKKTSKGNDWTAKLCRDTAYRIKKRYGLNWGEPSKKKNDKFETKDIAIELQTSTRERHTEYIRENYKKTFGIDNQKLAMVETETKEAQTILSEIFVEENNNEVKIDEMRGGNSFLVILKMLFAKEQWLYSEVEELCKKHDMMIGSVLELINDYAYEKIGDSVIEDDGEYINVTTEYKDMLI